MDAPVTVLLLTSVAAIVVLNTVGAFTPSTTMSLSLPSKLNLSNEYLPALVRPESRSVQDSDTTVLEVSLVAACAAAVVLFAARVTPVKVVDVTPVYVNCSLFICRVPLDVNPAVDATVIVPDPVMDVLEEIAELDPVPNEVVPALNIFSPLAATTLFAKVATIRTFSSDEDV
jgi:hypothetical protein